jgi:prevent-host-death family protein
VLKVTIHYAKTHLSRLLKEVQKGKQVIILHGETPVAQIIPLGSTQSKRPPVGKPTSEPVRWSQDAFHPLTDAELRVWGL